MTRMHQMILSQEMGGVDLQDKVSTVYL